MRIFFQASRGALVNARRKDILIFYIFNIGCLSYCLLIYVFILWRRLQVGEFFWGDQTMKPNGLSIGKDYFDHEIEKEKNFFYFSMHLFLGVLYYLSISLFIFRSFC